MFNPFASKTENPQQVGQALAAENTQQFTNLLEAVKGIQSAIDRITENLKEENGYILRHITNLFPGLITKEAFASATSITPFTTTEEEDVSYRGMRR